MNARLKIVKIVASARCPSELYLYQTYLHYYTAGDVRTYLVCTLMESDGRVQENASCFQLTVQVFPRLVQ